MKNILFEILQVEATSDLFDKLYAVCDKRDITPKERSDALRSVSRAMESIAVALRELDKRSK